MKYMGSKARHAKELLPIILKDHTPDMWYVEPFVGGANMIDKVDPIIAPKRTGCDVHEYLIAMWQAIRKGWTPPEKVTEADYNFVKDNKDFNKALTGYIGFSMSFGGKWFGGYRRDSIGKRDYAMESYRGMIKQIKNLEGVHFVNTSVFDLDLAYFSFTKPCTIYCDPPYVGTTKYKDDFDHDKFYTWCRDRHKEGHKVFISEYWMPDDFVCVWSKEVNNSLTKDTGSKKGIEKLFTLN
jgi:DNA adenine methylase